MNLIAVLLLLTFVAPANACTSPTEKPADLKLVCSATWLFQGMCNGEEMVFAWQTVSGQTVAPPGDPFIRPWLDFPIVLIGMELLRRDYNIDERNNRLSWFMVGSAITGQPDAMIWIGPGEMRTAKMWPPGHGQLWPSKDKANPSRLTDMLDLHGACFGGGPIEIFVTLYYTLAR